MLLARGFLLLPPTFDEPFLLCPLLGSTHTHRHTHHSSQSQKRQNKEAPRDRTDTPGLEKFDFKNRISRLHLHLLGRLNCSIPVMCILK